MTVVELHGCRTRPIGSYLKALGVLRLVGEQLDREATGFWLGDAFRLDVTGGEDALVTFFLERYRPTPLVSPWNGGSGFAPKDKSAIGAITAILETSDERFAEYRSTIETARGLVADPSWESGGKDKKQRQIARCRAMLPDHAVEWLDSSVVLANDRAVFPPLFGTGGNDGRLEFSSNFMQRLVELLVAPRRRGTPGVRSLLRGALFDESGPLEKGTSGQYDPGSVESDSTSASARETKLSNPWDVILLIEGGLVFASAAARRLGSAAGIRAAMPFCVDASPVGSATAAGGEEARGEIWTPVWRQPSAIGEVARLVGEGRAQWGRDQAGSGVDFAKAVATLGVDRGIDRFVRHGILKRNGLAFFSVPLGEVMVGTRPEVNVLQPVDRWLRRLKSQLPASAASARRRVEAAEYRAAADPSARPAPALQRVLVELADLELAIARSTDRGDVLWPVGGGDSRLPAADWLPCLDDGSPELRVAAALSSARDRFPAGELDLHSRTASSLCLILRPVQLDARGSLVWSQGSPRVGGVDRRPIREVLVASLVDREVRGDQRAHDDDQQRGDGVDLWFDVGIAAEVDDLLALAEGRLDLDRVGRLLRALLLLDWRRRGPREGHAEGLRRPETDGAWKRRITPAMAVLLPFFHGHPILAEQADGTDIEVELRPRPGWPRQLAAGHVDAVLDEAVHRLRVAGLRPAVDTVRPTAAEASGALAIAALCRTSRPTARRCLRQTCPSDSQVRELAVQATEITRETS